MEIKLDQPREIIIREEQKINTDTILINQLVDNGTSVIALISFKTDGIPISISKEIILWDGDAYVNINQWTDEDVRSRIKEII